ncbi:MAG TPA: serine/threonine-protein kinase [Pseudomonadota bacterium]|nr:serine/threonine-protein kinase [Pseudomonadota bacterium]
MEKPQQIENYRVLRELGRGGMGVVYEAEHREFRSRVAIKVLHPRLAQDPQILARFRLEAVAANVPQHPGIARVLGGNVLPNGDLPYIVMEFLDGKPLRRRLAKNREGLPEMVAVRFGKQIADALAAAHAKKIVHRDIKPENIMIVRDDAVPGGERAKVLDFGIAAVAAEIAASESQSDTQVKTSPFAGLIGTAAYMAPEQCQRIGNAPIDERADVYALGTVIYEMLCGHPPFVEGEAVSLMYNHIHKPPEPLRKHRPQLMPDLEDLVMRMLAKSPDRRPTMREVSLALSQLDQNSAPSLPGLSTLDESPRASRKRFALYLLLGALSLVASGFLVQQYVGGTSRITWKVSSQPSGAALVDPDGRTLGTTPFEETKARDLGKITVEVRLPGFAAQRIVLDRAEDYDRTLVLSPDRR